MSSPPWAPSSTHHRVRGLLVPEPQRRPLSGTGLGGTVLVGTVLVGGGSTRMGVDKATMLLDGQKMARYSTQALRDAGIDRILIGGGHAALALELGAELVPDLVEGCGPLGGLHAALSRASVSHCSPEVAAEGDLVVVITPCDVPGVSAVDIGAMLELMVNERDLDVVCVVGPHGREPLVSAWRPVRCMAAVAERLQSPNRSVHGVLETLNVGEVLTSDPASLNNINKPGDLCGGLRP